MNKRLYRDPKNGKLFGVCAGVSDYLDVDVTVVRLLWVAFGCMGVGVFVYLVGAFIMPVKGSGIDDHSTN